jgi:hypothetical protein
VLLAELVGRLVDDPAFAARMLEEGDLGDIDDARAHDRRCDVRAVTSCADGALLVHGQEQRRCPPLRDVGHRDVEQPIRLIDLAKRCECRIERISLLRGSGGSGHLGNDDRDGAALRRCSWCGRQLDIDRDDVVGRRVVRFDHHLDAPRGSRLGLRLGLELVDVLELGGIELVRCVGRVHQSFEVVCGGDRKHGRFAERAGESRQRLTRRIAHAYDQRVLSVATDWKRHQPAGKVLGQQCGELGISSFEVTHEHRRGAMLLAEGSRGVVEREHAPLDQKRAHAQTAARLVANCKRQRFPGHTALLEQKLPDAHYAPSLC